MAKTDNAIFGKNVIDKIHARINSLIQKHTQDINTLTQKHTQDITKVNSSIQAVNEALEQLKKSVSDGKNLVANTITSHLVGTSVTKSIDGVYPSFQDIANAINSIPLYRDNIFYASASSNHRVALPGGYYNNYTVDTSAEYNAGYTAGQSAAQPLGTAVASDVLTGKTFQSSSAGTASGSTTAGTMPNNGALNWNPSKSTSKTVAAGYYSGGTLSTANAYEAGKIKGVSEFKAGLPDVDLYIGVAAYTTSLYNMSGRIALKPFKTLGYKTVSWNTGGNRYGIVTRESSDGLSGGDDVTKKSYCTNGKDDNYGQHTVNITSDKCPDHFYISWESNAPENGFSGRLTYTFTK